jgi:hypothetical protein
MQDVPVGAMSEQRDTGIIIIGINVRSVANNNLRSDLVNRARKFLDSSDLANGFSHYRLWITIIYRSNSLERTDVAGYLGSSCRSKSSLSLRIYCCCCSCSCSCFCCCISLSLWSRPLLPLRGEYIVIYSVYQIPLLAFLQAQEKKNPQGKTPIV